LGGAGLRQAQKAATRERVLAAARELFATQGYEGATIRQIATLAGVSVGSVFTTFASKGQILSEVMLARLDGMYAELDQVTPRWDGTTADRLRSMFAFYVEFEMRHAQLFLAHISAAFDWTLPPDARPCGRNPRLTGLIEDCLASGVARGDVDPAADLPALVDLLLAAFGWTFRLVAWESAGAQELITVMDQQIGLIAKGFNPRS
jgi:AcrR family transcriptional regulator